MSRRERLRPGESLASYRQRMTWYDAWRAARLGLHNLPPHFARAAYHALVNREWVLDPLAASAYAAEERLQRLREEGAMLAPAERGRAAAWRRLYARVATGDELRDYKPPPPWGRPIAPVIPMPVQQRTRTCGIPWPVCPHCPGQPLRMSLGRASCGWCLRDWPEADRMPCREGASVLVRDQEGQESWLCPSHAARALHQVVGLVLVEGDPLRGTVWCAAPHGDRWCRIPLLAGETRHPGDHECAGVRWAQRALGPAKLGVRT